MLKMRLMTLAAAELSRRGPLGDGRAWWTPWRSEISSLSLIKTVEYNLSYVYHAMYAYFDRDNIALKGLAIFFKESSVEEREHVEKLVEYQNKRGGRVKLQSIVMPLTEFEHVDKGYALYGKLLL
ncbi:unnamed protein product [Microthlaspi erraticum]|uniref:Ferritin n=1 Tax=Microthlaspi erraticum TaxID=1685480 RepID=A0A6D2KUD0_9BRAS|nr:unnamed protein product [Microthlaspi erraticum]